MTTASIYDGQRAQPENKRAFILTRSAFTGMQRNAAAAVLGHAHHFRFVQTANSRRIELFAYRAALLDKRHRRLCWRRHYPPGLPRTLCAMVRIRPVLSLSSGLMARAKIIRMSCGLSDHRRSRFSRSMIGFVTGLCHTSILWPQRRLSTATHQCGRLRSILRQTVRRSYQRLFRFGPSLLVAPVTGRERPLAMCICRRAGLV